MKVDEAAKTYDVVIVGSPNVNDGYKLVGNSAYPDIESDYERTFRVLKSLPIDIFLGAHGSYFDLQTKYPRLNGGTVNPFIDLAGYNSYVIDREKAFRTELGKAEDRVHSNPRSKHSGICQREGADGRHRSNRLTPMETSSSARHTRPRLNRSCTRVCRAERFTPSR